MRYTIKNIIDAISSCRYQIESEITEIQCTQPS